MYYDHANKKDKPSLYLTVDIAETFDQIESNQYFQPPVREATNH